MENRSERVATFLSDGKTINCVASMQLVSATAWSALASVPNGWRGLAEQLHDLVEHEIVEKRKSSKFMHTLKSGLQAMLSQVLEDHIDGKMKGLLDPVFKRDKLLDMLKRYKTKMPSGKSTFKHPVEACFVVLKTTHSSISPSKQLQLRSLAG